MRTIIPLALTLAAPAALACGPYVPRPTVNAHALVSAELPDGTAVSTTSVPGQLRLTRDGHARLVDTGMWTIRDLEVAGDRLVLAGSRWGMPSLVIGDGEAWTTVPVHDVYMGDVADVEVSASGGDLVFAAVVESSRSTEDTERALTLTRWSPTPRS